MATLPDEPTPRGTVPPIVYISEKTNLAIQTSHLQAVRNQYAERRRIEPWAKVAGSWSVCSTTRMFCTFTSSESNRERMPGDISRRL